LLTPSPGISLQLPCQIRFSLISLSLWWFFAEIDQSLFFGFSRLKGRGVQMIFFPSISPENDQHEDSLPLPSLPTLPNLSDVFFFFFNFFLELWYPLFASLFSSSSLFPLSNLQWPSLISRFDFFALFLPFFNRQCHGIPMLFFFFPLRYRTSHFISFFRFPGC